MAPVKRSPSPRAQQTRLRIIEAARDLFVADGYGATSLQDVADRAGVAVQTVYFAFGNKRTLLKELVDVTVAGDDEPIATMDRPWFQEALDAPTAQEHLRLHVAGSSAVLARVAPVTKVLDTAVATDPEVAAMWPDPHDPRYVVAAAAGRSLAAKPGAAGDAQAAADLLYGLLSPELYLLLVGERGWSQPRWEEWVYATLRAQLCVD
jgi:AcrR family transcriptional regulator